MCVSIPPVLIEFQLFSAQQLRYNTFFFFGVMNFKLKMHIIQLLKRGFRYVAECFLFRCKHAAAPTRADKPKRFTTVLCTSLRQIQLNIHHSPAGASDASVFQLLVYWRNLHFEGFTSRCFFDTVFRDRTRRSQFVRFFPIVNHGRSSFFMRLEDHAR